MISLTQAKSHLTPSEKGGQKKLIVYWRIYVKNCKLRVACAMQSAFSILMRTKMSLMMCLYGWIDMSIDALVENLAPQPPI